MLKLVHVPGVVPTWSTPNVFPAIAALPDRASWEVFACHQTVVTPLPLPLVGDTVIQLPFPLAYQLPPWHPPGDPVIVTCWDPAPDPALAYGG